MQVSITELAIQCITLKNTEKRRGQLRSGQV